MSALTVVQEVCLRIGIPRPNAAVSSADPQVQQILAIANEAGQSLASRCAWTDLVREATFTTVNSESQGKLSTLAPGVKYILNDTIQDRDELTTYGPLSPQEWQHRKSQNFSGPFYGYRIRSGELLVDPAPPAGHIWAFEYVSKNWVCDVEETTTREAYQADDDWACIDEGLVLLGTIWRWLKRKGFEYGEDFNEYERQVADAMARDGTKAVIDMAGRQERGPGVLIPEGSWNL